MPLPFATRDGSVIAFGFFNIDLDMLLLAPERQRASVDPPGWFFFADDFCAAVRRLHHVAPQPEGTIAVDLPGFRPRDAAAVGNVNAAISAGDRSGFIGATYQAFPFPRDPADFKQQPDGARNRDWAAARVLCYTTPVAIPMRWSRNRETLSIAEVVFTTAGAAALVAYVDRGGYPRWRDDQRPPYVSAMTRELAELDSPLGLRRGVLTVGDL